MTSEKQPSSPAGRIVHAIFFFGFAAITIAATSIEVVQLWRGLMRPFHSGTPPAPVPTASGLVAAFGVLVIIACLTLGRSVPLVVSGLMLAALACGVFPLIDPDDAPKPVQRSVPGANLQMLEAARLVHQQLIASLQSTGKVPDDITLPTVESPFRRRGFAVLPWHLERTSRTDALPDGAQPGWILLTATADRASFTIGAVGLDSNGEPAILRDERGVAVELRGVFNPDTAG